MLTKSLSGRTTRRRLLPILSLGGVLAAGFAQPGATKRRRSRRRKANRQSVGNWRPCLTLSRSPCYRINDGISDVWFCPENTNLENTNMANCDLRGAIMRRIQLRGANFTGAILNNAHLDGSQAEQVTLTQATMVNATFVGTNLGTFSQFVSADMRFADFTGASLNGALLTGASLDGSIFQDADLRNIVWTMATCPDGFDLLYPFTTSTCCGHLKGYTTAFCSGRDD